jgi:NhaC family Na+:H+ antiporter
MIQVILLLFPAFSFAGIMVHCGLFQRILKSLVGSACGTRRLVSLTVVTGILTSLVTGSSHLSVIVPGKLFAAAYRSANLAAKNLSRTTEDSGSVVVPLIPWSAAGLFMAATLGVPTLTYLPWTVMNYTGFLFALLYGATGFAIAPRKRDDESLPDS